MSLIPTPPHTPHPNDMVGDPYSYIYIYTYGISRMECTISWKYQVEKRTHQHILAMTHDDLWFNMCSSVNKMFWVKF